MTDTRPVQDLRAQYDENGFVRVPGLFSREEVGAFVEHFMTLRASGPLAGDLVGADPHSDDPLLRYPRMIHMHHWDPRSREFLLEPRLTSVLRALLDQDVIGVQTMLYFKPPGARGQALHQDDFFLTARDGECMGAWLSLDVADADAGCLRVVPGSHRWPLLCTVEADVRESFTDVTVPLPPEVEAVDVPMEPGDVLFFHGHLVHGSLPNRTPDRFRRSLIAHYVSERTTAVSRHTAPGSLRLDGSPADLGVTEEGAPCGTWVTVDGTPVVELTGWDSLESASVR
jgi:ectoine hydroxylase-related dioxygenase (phytanoyl-CoA dioxygenase family)